ncbi:hypothetical protein F4778DRAFT_741205 [Xylariomycetidae sp. FL2044]|nr:hypothetical protein F4778DRAFT_741205 [Xylariomycetidae sp. FL2044]
MSLGVQLLWRAQYCAARVKELSLIPREPLKSTYRYAFHTGRSWHSAGMADSELPTPTTPTANTSTTKTHPSTADVRNIADPEDVSRSKSAHRRSTLRKIIRQRSQAGPTSSEASALTRPFLNYPDKLKSRRSWVRHCRSAATQYLDEHFREAMSRPLNDWYSTLAFLLRHTPRFGSIVDFQIVIGREIAAKAREALSGIDTSLGDIRRRYQCVLRVEESNPGDERLLMSLSGSETSVRASLLEIVRIVGELTVRRAPDSDLDKLLADAMGNPGPGRLPVRFLSDGQLAAGEDIMTVERTFDGARLSSFQPRRYRDYKLTRRPDEIIPPSMWTKLSFEGYVAALVHGKIPTHEIRRLYPRDSDPQHNVVSLLVDTFTNPQTQTAISVSALKMALKFIQKKGRGFRPAARTLLLQAESFNLPLDAEVFEMFIRGAAESGDLDGFNSVLRLMIRKHFLPRIHTWHAFLDMIREEIPKRFILGKMAEMGLDRSETARQLMTRQIATFDLERELTSEELNIEAFIYARDLRNGEKWLDTWTLNKLLNTLMAHNQRQASQELLDFVHTRRRAMPDASTMNTLISHTSSMKQQIAALHLMQSRWSHLQPDTITYDLFFQFAWKKGMPNMLRVLWRYGALARTMSSKWRQRLLWQLSEEHSLSAKRAFLKSWEDVIVGQKELSEARASHGGRLAHRKVYTKYVNDNDNNRVRPRESLATKLDEAYDLDIQIRRRVKEGQIITASMKEKELTVDIPLEKIRGVHGVSVFRDEF